MDYAKLALLKAEELEKNGVNSAPQICRKGFVVKKTLSAGESFSVCKIKGKGEAALMLSLSLEATAGQALGGNIALVLGGKTAFSRPASASMFFTASTVPDGEIAVKIKIDSTVKLLSADILVIGAEITGVAGADVKIDFLDGFCGAVYENEGQIRLCSAFNTAGNPPGLGDYAIAGFGKKPAVAVTVQDGRVCFGILFIDGEELVFSLFDTDKRQIVCNYTGVAADSAALIRYGGGLAAGYTSKGIAYAGIISKPDFTLGQSLRIEAASAVEFVREAFPPVVILNKNGKNVIRTAQPESVYDDAIYINFECMV